MDDEQRLRAHLTDLARRGRGGLAFSPFLDPAQRKIAEMVAGQLGVLCIASGGAPDCERVVCAFSPDAEIGDYPIACIRADWDARYGTPSHRDLLGAEMALGLARSRFGDILLGESCAYLLVLEDAAAYLLSNLDQAGRCKLRLARVDLADVAAVPPKGRTLRATLASLRLDALMAAAWRISRSDAQTCLSRELVKVNHVSETRADRRLTVGDLVSLRGYGRVRVCEDQGMTKKGRQAVTLFLYEQ